MLKGEKHQGCLWAQVVPSESSNRLRRFRGSKEGKEPREGSESMSLKSRVSLHGRREEGNDTGPKTLYPGPQPPGPAHLNE